MHGVLPVNKIIRIIYHLNGKKATNLITISIVAGSPSSKVKLTFITEKSQQSNRSFFNLIKDIY
jgi:hypothetical protein